MSNSTGMIYLSRKTKRPPVVGARYWAHREMFDFMPHTAYDVPFSGTRLPSEQVLYDLHERIYLVEMAADPLNNVGVHIEVHDQGYLTITIGVFAT